MNYANTADLIVYGTIYTSDAAQRVVEAAAIKDGKYIYVGDRAGAEAYVGDHTKVIEQKDGMIMAGGTEAHGHYIVQSVEKFLVQSGATSLDELKKDIREYMDEHPDKKAFAGAGWNFTNDLLPDADTDYAKQLDEVCADKPIAIFDAGHHQMVLNSKALRDTFGFMGIDLIDSKKGREDTETLPGGVVLRLADGRPNGYLRDQAAMYMGYLLFGDVLTNEDYDAALQDMQTTLYERGYTNYHDGMINVFGNRTFEAIVKADKDGRLKVCMLPNFCVYACQVKNDELINNAIEEIYKFHQQSSDNLIPAGTKLFIDGVTDAATGLNDVPYIGTDNYGLEIITEEQIYKVTKASNEKGIPVHTHTFGNVAVRNTVSAFIKAQNEVNNGTHNTLAHVRNVLPEDYQRMADNNIAVALNINWGHTLTDTLVKLMEQVKGIPRNLQIEAYPIKSLLDHGVVVGSSTDAPAACNMPTDVFGIAEMAVDRASLGWTDNTPEPIKAAFGCVGYIGNTLKAEDVLNMAECVPVKSALDIMTIGGARLIGIDNTRGSIEVGKSADFIIVDKNVLECATTEIHKARIIKVYYDGELVYERKQGITAEKSGTENR